MELVVNGIITGILTGGVYALMASGLTLIFGVMDIINVGQGALVILGAYLSYLLEVKFQVDLFLGLLITMPIMFLFGLFLEWAFIRPLKRDRTILSILVTFAIALVIEGFLGLAFSTSIVKLRSDYVDTSFQIGNFYLAHIYVYGFVLSLVLLAGLYVILYRTKFGYSLRSSSASTWRGFQPSRLGLPWPSPRPAAWFMARPRPSIRTATTT